MNVKWDAKTGLPAFTLDEKDLQDAREIKLMMESEGWKVLQNYWEVGKDSILDAGMDGIRTKTKRDLSSEKWAILKGFLECSKIAERIVKRAEDYKPKNEAESEQDDAREGE